MIDKNQPMTEAELKEFMKTAKVEMADSDYVEANKKNVAALMVMVGKYMDPDPEWQQTFATFAQSVFVSDESTLRDFNLEDADMKALGDDLGFPVNNDDCIFQIAAKMPGGSQ